MSRYIVNVKNNVDKNCDDDDDVVSLAHLWCHEALVCALEREIVNYTGG